MGLDTTHNCWHGPYGRFKAFREALAVTAKAEFGYEPNYESHPMRAFFGWWDSDEVDFIRHDLDRGFQRHTYRDPLDIFFVHSDCEGFIFPRDAQALIPALTQLLLARVKGGEQEWQPELAQFIEGLQSAVDEWEVVEFY